MKIIKTKKKNHVHTCPGKRTFPLTILTSGYPGVKGFELTITLRHKVWVSPKLGSSMSLFTLGSKIEVKLPINA
jgi:hypothetical protein